MSWQIDPMHTQVEFAVKHFGLMMVRGRFSDLRVSGTADPEHPELSSFEVTIGVASLNTNNALRDNDLRGSNFLELEKYPTITFRSTRVEANGEALRVHGALTMRGVTRPVVLEGRYLGVTPAGQGGQRIGFEAETTINRHDFGVSWNRAAEGGGVVLGDEVTISLVVAAVRQ